MKAGEVVVEVWRFWETPVNGWDEGEKNQERFHLEKKSSLAEFFCLIDLFLSVIESYLDKNIPWAAILLFPIAD